MKFKLFGAEAWIQKWNSVCLSDPVVNGKMCLSGCKHVQIRCVASLMIQSRGKKKNKGQFPGVFISQNNRTCQYCRFVRGIPTLLYFHSSHPPLRMGRGGCRIGGCCPWITQSSCEGFMRWFWSDLSLTPCLSLMLRDPWNRPCRCRCFERRRRFSSFRPSFLPFHLSFSPVLPSLSWKGTSLVRMMAGDRWRGDPVINPVSQSLRMTYSRASYIIR